jgi:fucose 4-O-acetylase-like acetyltransferase
VNQNSKLLAMGDDGAQQSRVDWVDAAKGFGIILVVVGHAIRGLLHARILTETLPVQCVDTWIYSFHMPLFFFLTGLFIAGSAEKNTLPHFTFDKAATLAYPYFVWSIITILLKAALGPLPTTPRSWHDLPMIFYHPIEQYWFLYTLFVLSIGFKLLYLSGTSFWIFLAAAIAIHPAAAPLLLDSSVMADVSRFAIYFAIGAAIGSLDLRDVDKLNSGVLALIGISGLTSAAGRILLPQSGLYPVFATLGICGACATAVLISRSTFAPAFQYLGHHSLEIFVVHTMASAGTRILLVALHVSSPFIHLVAGIVAGLLAPIALAIALKRAGVQYAFSLKTPP